ncbi:MAG: putative phosphoribosyl transferase [Burkholderiaceae bacterium]|nr:putative phosphoribosyl transferase [Burkholderiaceae bacterium]
MLLECPSRPRAALRMSPPAIESFRLQIGGDRIAVELAVPAAAKGVVVFASGAAVARPSQRFVHAVMHRHGLATLRFVHSAAAPDRKHTEPAPDRLLDALEWLQRHERWERTGLLAGGTAAHTALQAVALRPACAGAIVLGAADIDPAAARRLRVRAPTLLIVGGRDDELLPRNRELLRQLHGEKRLELVPGAGRRFEEPGALDAMAQMAARWFADHTEGAAAA